MRTIVFSALSMHYMTLRIQRIYGNIPKVKFFYIINNPRKDFTRPVSSIYKSHRAQALLNIKSINKY